MAESPLTGAPSAVVYQERLWPAFWVWLVAAGASSAAVFVFAPISLATGITAACVLFALLTGALIASTPRIVVTDHTLEVGRASIERRFVGEVEAFEGDAASHQRGPGLNATAYLCIRGWISPVVRIEITDDADPTPYWLTSTRRPAELRAALHPGGV